jgi:membrane fusion protein (multidrug efflux system)
VALLAACGEGDKKPGAGPAAGGPGAAPPPPEVEVLIVATGAATLTQDLPGRLMADTQRPGPRPRRGRG